MSRLDDYRDVMPLPNLSDDRIESILTGARLQRADTRDLEGFVGALAMTARLEQPRPDMARILAETARMTRPESVSPFWSRAAVLAATLGLVVTLGGVAVAANNSVPGDLLYPVDRALELVGIGDSGVEERMTEVEALIARGDHDRAQAVLEDLSDFTGVGAESEDVSPAQNTEASDVSTHLSTPGATIGDDSVPEDDRAEPGTGGTPSKGNEGNDNQPAHAGVPGQGNPDPGNPDQGGGSGSGNSGQGTGNDGSPPSHGNGNDGSPPGQGNGNQGSPPGQGTGNDGSPPGQGNGSQGSPPGQGTGNDGSPPGQGNGSQGNQGKGQA